MFDIGWQEFILIGLVAVLVVGPKDLPRVIRTVGQWIRKARSLASEFQGSLEEMAREAELDDVRKQVQQVSREGIGKSFEKHVDPDGQIRRSIEDARDSSGADEIEQAVDEAKRDTRALASERKDGSTAGSGQYESLAAATKIPDNSVKPPEETPPAAAEAKPAAASSGGSSSGATSTKRSPSKGSAAKPAAKTASKSGSGKSTAKAGASASKSTASKSAASKASASKPAAAKPKRTARSTTSGDAGEA